LCGLPASPSPHWTISYDRLLHGIHAPHLAASVPTCVRRVISTPGGKVLRLVEMELQLVIELPVDGSAL
jgi:hypothetical protein